VGCIFDTSEIPTVSIFTLEMDIKNDGSTIHIHMKPSYKNRIHILHSIRIIISEHRNRTKNPWLIAMLWMLFQRISPGKDLYYFFKMSRKLAHFLIPKCHVLRLSHRHILTEFQIASNSPVPHH
jgi:hypothetical protein